VNLKNISNTCTKKVYGRFLVIFLNSLQGGANAWTDMERVRCKVLNR